MSSNENMLSEQQRRQQNRGRLQAFAIISIVLLPMLIATFMFKTGVGVPEDRINKGNLINPPQHLDKLQLRSTDDEPWSIAEQPKKWRLVVPASSQCDAQCEQNLYLTRQVHIRLAEKSTRVERLYLMIDDQITAATEHLLASEHPHVPVVRTTEDKFNELIRASDLPADSLAQGHYYLVDQEGFIMLAYTPAHKGNELLDDIKRMLKYSYED